ncbi:MAG TPA: Sapep family Mn(2+)-dependent dipeptidase, partial [Armatimonadota bacterium]|nr:Sapep family Mn(2+)-dependent dipeptidase [Armatimonadota bacterium]
MISLDPALDAMNSWLHGRRDAMAADLARLIQAPSVRGPDRGAPVAGIAQALDVARELSERAGLRYRQIEDWVGYADLGEGSETVGVLLHLDVVPAGEGWTHPPFSGALVDGEVWGRGAQDDKGPVISVLHAAEAVARSGAPFQRRLRVIFGTDEESGVWTDIARYLECEPAPTLGFVPDGCFPITSGEKGVLNVDLVAPANRDAPARGITVTSLWAGERANIVPGSARAVLRSTASPESLAEALAHRADAYNSTHAKA